ncbi:MAG TPA: hypothetical protein VNX67_09895 [Solirubrobacteraceae bacterium]|nr:hypothetical protein [Solirubrobacteraceae bacterium]
MVLLLVLSQALLPPLVAKLVSDRFSRYGTVKRASVSAVPALELLWGKADSASVVAGALSVPSGRLASLIWEAHNVTNIALSADTATLTAIPSLPRGITVSDMRVVKRGSSIHASATLTERQLEEALPSGFRIEPLASSGGEVEVRASGALFGLQASIVAVVRGSGGRLVTEPRGLPFAGLASVTLFSDSHLKVEAVGFSTVRTDPLTYELSMTAVLH